MNPPKPEATMPQRLYHSGLGVDYISMQEHKAELAKARAEAIEKLELEVDRKLQSIMAGNISVLVDSYRMQINNVFEAARAEAKEAGGMRWG
jgi:hypothetical protein